MRPIRLSTAAATILALAVALQACDEGTTSTELGAFALAVTLEGLGTGSVTSEPAGIACDTTGDACSAEFEEGTAVTLTATPAEGFSFVAWGGDGTGTGALTVTMDADRSVTAEFDDPDMAVQTVGSDGGEVTSRDSAITLVFPAGALTGDEDITIERLDPSELGDEWTELRDGDDIAAAYEMGPAGLQFDVPVEVRLAPEAAVLEGDSVAVQLPELWTAAADTVESLDSIQVVTDLGVQSAETIGFLRHFSPLVRPHTGAEMKWRVPPETVPVGHFALIEVTGLSSTYEQLTEGPSPIAHATGDAMREDNKGSTFGATPPRYWVEYQCTRPGSVTITFRAPFRTAHGMDRSAIITTTIECVGHSLTVTTSGEGSGTVTGPHAWEDGTIGIVCGSQGTACQTDYAPGRTITLTATPDEGSYFAGWTVDGEVITPDGTTERSFTMDADKTIDARFEPVEEETVIDVSDYDVWYLEALSLVNAAFPFVQPSADLAWQTAGEACPTVLIAADAIVAAVDGCDGSLVQQYFSTTTLYDAYALPRPEGETGDHAIFATGHDYQFFWVDDAGEVTAQVRQTSWGTAPDATPINGDPADGLALIRNDGFGQMVYFVRYDPDKGYHDLLTNFVGTTATPPNAQSVFATGAPDDPQAMAEEMLVVGNTASDGLLYYIETVSETDPTWTEVGNLGGDNPRRIRCDLDAGVCAVSDFANSLVTVILWDGTGMPTIAGVTTAGQIADGPVGLDVFGSYIVTAGFNDDSYSIIEVDAAGAIVNATTTALPAECSQPGHAIFLRDGANTIMVSCNNSQNMVRVPGAF